MSNLLLVKWTTDLINAKNKIGQVAEGARTLEVVYHEANKMNVSMPLVNSLYEILYANASSDQLIQDLLEHPNEVDVEFIYQDKLWTKLTKTNY